MTSTAGQTPGVRGAAATFTQQADATTGRVGIAIVRPGNPAGVTGNGLPSAALFDAVDGGPENMMVIGTANDTRRTPVQQQFGSAPGVTVR